MKKYLVTSAICLVVLLVGVSVAFFTSQLTGSRKNVTVTSKELKIIFTDSANITAVDIEPGWDTSKTFTVESRSNEPFKYDILIKDLINTFVSTGNLQYKISSTNGGYSTNGAWVNVPKASVAKDVTIGNNITIPVGVTQTYTIYFRFRETGVNQDEDQGATFGGYLAIDEAKPTLVSKLLEINSTRLTRSDFSTRFNTDNTGTLYTTTNTEDGSTVYYFAGNAQNNWVKFGKCTNSSYKCTVGNDLYWRIIRTNEDIEDGGVRLLYAGHGSTTNQRAYISNAIKYYEYNASQKNPMYVGYMYGSSGSLENNRTNQVNKSIVASTVESWYTNTFNNDSDSNTKDSEGNLLDNYINPAAIYCNDRSVGSGNYSTDSSVNFYFGAYTRIITNLSPSYACGATEEGYGHYFEGSSSIADKFTGSTTNTAGTTIGNGLLGESPAALITADELSFAGGVHDNNTAAWYVRNSEQYVSSITYTNHWWTMTPSNWETSYPEVYYSNANATTLGNISDGMSSNTKVVRPVISLKANVLWASGDGSPSSPFEVYIAD